jgi:organic radical activating enzyme
VTTLIDTKAMKDRLDKVSPSFCLAKWTQVTLRLGDGFNHSCHHPPKHKIVKDDIANNPTFLHNTAYKKAVRKDMLKGLRPTECSYCWTVEDADSSVVSDRLAKSSSYWSVSEYETVVNDPFQNITPTYVEVSFNNTCNLKCGYCNPFNSTRWASEITQYGGYPTSTNFNNVDVTHLVQQRENNVYIDAFWKWWPELSDTLKVFRITGGEPLLTKNTFDVIDKIAENPKQLTEFSVNSNLCVPDFLIDKLINKLLQVDVQNKFVYTSCEARGAKAEYIRYGMSYDKWLSNCRKLTDAGCKIIVMCTFNALSVTSFVDFVKDVKSISNDILLDISFLKDPNFLSINILDDVYQSHIDSLLGVVSHPREINNVKRLSSVFKARDNNVARLRQDFYNFITEHDRRRNTNFHKTFPEMINFLNDCNLE